MTLTQLEYVLAVNKFRHFGKAAKSCFITQPTLSMQLQKLEDELDTILFDRSKSPILPTSEGKAIIQQAKVILNEAGKINDIVKSGKKNLEGDFKLAVIPTLAPYLLPQFIQNFVKKHPNVNLIIEEYKTEDIITQLDDDQIDAGLLVTPLHNDMIIEKVLYYEPFYLFIAPKHPFLKKSKIKQCDLKLEDIWLLNKGNCFRDQVLNICAESMQTKYNHEQDKIRFESGNMETLKNMVLASSGYTLLPQMAVAQLQCNQELIRPFTTPIPTREVSIVYSRSFLNEKIINALETEIILTLPKELRSTKRANYDIVEIY